VKHDQSLFAVLNKLIRIMIRFKKVEYEMSENVKDYLVDETTLIGCIKRLIIYKI